MAQPQQQQQQYVAAQGSYSPPHDPNSPAMPPQQFPNFPNKRQRLSPNPSSQPGSPYVSQSPYSTPAPQQAIQSPHFANVQLPPHAYTTPYSNGNSTSSLTLPQSQHHHNGQQQNPLNFSIQNQLNQSQNYNSSFTMGSQGPGTMGPPSKPVEKPKEDGIDVMDVLGGTGIDLREEEQYTFQMFNDSFNSSLTGSQSGTISAGHSFSQFLPGNDASFYGAGPANAAGEKADTETQNEYAAKAADKAWRDAARNLHVSRQRELDNPFLHVHLVHAKLRKLASEHGIELNTDSKGMMGIMTRPHAFPDRDVRIQAAVGPDGILVTTSGSFLPFDSMLVDQLALLSIATKHRLRGLIEDATKLSRGRRTGSHGLVPEEWAEISAPVDHDGTTSVGDGKTRCGWESTVNPSTNPMKRSMSIASKIQDPISDGGKNIINSGKVTNEVINALRRQAIKERDLEEARLRKRLDRAAGVSSKSGRQSSIIPGTPGSVAPEMPDKAPTKKEQKKKAEAKVNEAASHAATNVTTAQFLGGRKGKKYSWLNPAPGGGGGGGSSGGGISTPGRSNTPGLPPTPGANNAPPERLTAEGVRRLGMWKEDREKGSGIQIRDWITVLENDGHEKRALQKAYMNLDTSDPK